MIVRIYTGRDGQTHFEDLPLPAEESHNIALQAGAKEMVGKLRVAMDAKQALEAGRRPFLRADSGDADISRSAPSGFGFVGRPSPASCIDKDAP
jgi:hypothetical protein